MRATRLAKIVELTEILYEPVEHAGLHTSNTNPRKESLIDIGLQSRMKGAS
jgi:hypothetical protein